MNAMVLERGRENLCPHARFHVLRAVEPGDTLLDLVAGSSGTGFLGVYARLAGADEVYQVRAGPSAPIWAGTRPRGATAASPPSRPTAWIGSVSARRVNELLPPAEALHATMR